MRVIAEHVCYGGRNMLSLCVTFLRYLAAWLFTLVASTWACLAMVLFGPKRGWLLSCHFWARNTLKIVGVRLNIEGVENLRGPALFISNHQSLIDVVFLPAILPGTVRFVAKKELLFIPIWGWGFALGGAVLIDRTKPREALKNMRRGLRRLPKGWSLVIFPEGTRPKDGRMLPFKRGAFRIAVETRLPIVPIGMDGARDIVPPHGWLVRSGEVRVTVGRPIDTRSWRSESLAEHVAASRAAVQRCVDRSVARRGENATDSPDVVQAGARVGR
jgi:1-acyl-sn-glycerol-3-phosphate acyltransferase